MYQQLFLDRNIWALKKAEVTTQEVLKTFYYKKEILFLQFLQYHLKSLLFLKCHSLVWFMFQHLSTNCSDFYWCGRSKCTDHFFLFFGLLLNILIPRGLTPTSAVTPGCWRTLSRVVFLMAAGEIFSWSAKYWRSLFRAGYIRLD